MTLPPEAPSPGDYRSPRTIAKCVTGAITVYLAADAYAVLLSIEGLDLIERLESGAGVSEETIRSFTARFDHVVPITYGALVFSVIAFFVWTHRVASNAVAFGAPLVTPPGWAVGYYFIPVLNLWKPYQALGDVWRGSDPAGRVDPKNVSMTRRLPWFFLPWWLTWFASDGIERVASMMVKHSESFEANASGFQWLLVAAGIDVVAAVLCLTVVWKLTQRQEQRAVDAMPRAHIVESG